MTTTPEGASPAKRGAISAQIRELARQGLPRAEIARRLGKRYQHVRNVLEHDAVRENAAPESTSTRQAGSIRLFMEHYRVRRLSLEPDGSLRLPEDVVRRLGVAPGERVVIESLDDQVTLFSEASARRKAEGIDAHDWPPIPDRRLGGEALIAERGRESQVEDAKSMAEGLRWSS